MNCLGLEAGRPRICFYTHHKCGSTWLFWLLQSLCRDNNEDLYLNHLGNALPSPSSRFSLLQNAQWEMVRNNMVDVNIHFIRNPMSIVLSAYHSHMSTHPIEGWDSLSRQRKKLRTSNYSEGLNKTLDFLQSEEFHPGTPGPLLCLKSWNYADKSVSTMRMEDAVVDPSRFIRLIAELSGIDDGTIPDPDQFKFEVFTGRKIGQIDDSSHYRSGDPEAWRTSLPANIIETLRRVFREYLELFYPETLLD